MKQSYPCWPGKISLWLTTKSKQLEHRSEQTEEFRPKRWETQLFFIGEEAQGKEQWREGKVSGENDPA